MSGRSRVLLKTKAFDANALGLETSSTLLCLNTAHQWMMKERGKNVRNCCKTLTPQTATSISQYMIE